jgi:glyoxylase-like metal-dependent hydrolase (beta-lactamase superfamily II)
MGAVAVLAATGFAVTANGQQDFSKVTIETQDLGGGVYMMTGAGGNLGVSVGENGVLLIDDQYAPLSDKIAAAISALSDKGVTYLFNTHHHGDHTGGNENFGNGGAIIVAHDNVRRRLSADQVDARGNDVLALPDAAWPVITYSDKTTFYYNGQEVNAHHTPAAHTDGDVIIHFKQADVIHMGDTFFNNMYPFIDVSAGGGIDGVIDAHNLALSLAGPNTKIIPGHGPLATVADLIATRDLIASARDAIKPMVDAGKSAEEIVAAKPLDALNLPWPTDGFITPDIFAQLVATSLSN